MSYYLPPPVVRPPPYKMIKLRYRREENKTNKIQTYKTETGYAVKLHIQA